MSTQNDRESAGRSGDDLVPCSPWNAFFNDRGSLVEYLAERDCLIEPEAAQRILECWQLDGVYLPANFLEGVRSRGTVITAREMLLYLQIMKAFGYGDPYVL